MDIFSFFSMLGGLALFLYGMNLMGSGSKSFPAVSWSAFLKK